MALDFRKWHANEMKRRPRRASTRWLLLTGLALVAVIPVMEMMASIDRGGVLPNVVPFALTLIFASSVSPFTREAFLTDRGVAAFDEFEQAALLSALRRSYLAVIVILVGLFVWLIAGARLGWPLPRLPRQWGAIGFAVVITVVALPATFAEFMVPMPDPEDEMM